MQRILKFCIMGKPIAQNSRGGKCDSLWSKQKQARFNYEMEIIKQLTTQLDTYSDEEPDPIDGDVEIDIHFFIAPLPMKRIKTCNHTSHNDLPRLSDLIRFVENVLHNIVFVKLCKIIKINSDKMFDDTPRTEITITIYNQETHENHQ